MTTLTKGAHAPRKAADITLSPHASSACAFGVILSDCMGQIAANAPGARHSEDPEFIHQMRVGLRRLSSAMRLFQAVAPAPSGMKEELNWLAGTLGKARDWDVLTGTTLPGLEGADGSTRDTAALVDAAARMAAVQRHAVVQALSAERYTRLVLALKKWRRQIGKQDDGAEQDEQQLDVSRFADAVLRQAYSRLRRRAQHLDDAPQRHRVRIAAKRLRYALEFFASLYGQRKVKRLLKRVARLQATLGNLNDAAVAGSLLHQLAGSDPALAEIAGFAHGTLAARSEQALAPLPEQLRRLLRTATPFPA